MKNGIVYTNRDSCEACSGCLRVCQVKSIKMMGEKAEIIPESCLNCGLCISSCSKGAKKYKDGIESVEILLRHKNTALILAPSYVIVAIKHYRATPLQFCTALKKLGFSLVYESSFGADLVTKVYLDYITELINKKGKENTHVIASPCPSLMNYVEKHVPELIEEFAPILSPMAAQAVLVRHWNSGDLAVVGGSPCVAKKSELLDEKLGLYDEDLTFEEIIKMLDSRGIIPSALKESEFDGIQAFYGAGFPISGGLTKTIELFSDALEINPIGNDILIIEGEDRSTGFLKKMAEAKQKNSLLGYPALIDILYCEGCIMGKAMGVGDDLYENKHIVAEYTMKRFRKAKEKGLLKKYKNYEVIVKNTVEAPQFRKWAGIVEQLIKEKKFLRKWENRHYRRNVPGPEDMRRIMEADGKFSPNDELNCGACGYKTCRERAIAVYNNENEPGGCIIHKKNELKRLYESITDNVSTKLQEYIENLITAIGEITNGNQNNSSMSSDLLKKVLAQSDNVKGLDKNIANMVEYMNYISEIVANISAIADQTKLLSFNAQIEAAKAGEMGRGFSVVAEEVEKLSRDTHEKVKAVRDFQDRAQFFQEELDTIIKRLVNETESIGSLAESQAAISQQIAASSQEVLAATENLKTFIK